MNTNLRASSQDLKNMSQDFGNADLKGQFPRISGTQHQMGRIQNFWDTALKEPLLGFQGYSFKGSGPRISGTQLQMDRIQNIWDTTLKGQFPMISGTQPQMNRIQNFLDTALKEPLLGFQVYSFKGSGPRTSEIQTASNEFLGYSFKGSGPRTL